MLLKKNNARPKIQALLVIILISGLVLGACDGMNFNVQVDEQEDGGFTITGGGDANGEDDGGGTITITGSDEQEEPDEPSLDTSTVLLFGVILAIFFGVIALVISSSRRPRA
jgi:hypothetical protein